MNDKPSDNAPDNTNSNINSAVDNNSNDSPIHMNCERTRMHYMQFSISSKWIRQIHIWTLYKIKPNSERTDRKW